MHHNPCFNSFILHNHSFDNQGSEINKNDIFIYFDIMSFTKTQSNIYIYIYIYIYALIEFIYIHTYMLYTYTSIYREQIKLTQVSNY